MRKIEFIAPVESMRGNLGSKQNLVYAPNNNRAFDSIEGQVNPALNYESRLIGAKGKRNYFCVKTKSSVHLTQNSKAAMADFGGLGAVYAAIVRDKSSEIYIKINSIYQKGVEEGQIIVSFRKYVSRYIAYMLKDKLGEYTFTDGVNSISIGNPWVIDLSMENPAPKISVHSDILLKFWMELALERSGDDYYLPIVFYLDILTGVAFDGDTFGDMINMNNNILNLTIDNDGYVRSGNSYVIDDSGNYVGSSSDVYPNGKYTTTNVAPE